MDLEALRSFYHVARERSFSRAARRLHISQPAMSVRIKALEEELGERLFDRARKGVRLTEAGAVLFESTEQIFTDVENALARLRELRASGGGRVRIGCSDTMSLYLLPSVLDRFRKRFASAEISIRHDHTAGILDRLVRGDLDFGVVTKPPSVDRRLETRPLFEEEFVAACRRNDPLLRRAQVPLAALDGRPMVALQKGTETRDALDRELLRARAEPRIVLETGNIEVQKHYAAAGFGCAILPEGAIAKGDRRRLQVRPLKGRPLARTVVVALSRDRYLPRAAAALLELLEASPSLAPVR